MSGAPVYPVGVKIVGPPLIVKTPVAKTAVAVADGVGATPFNGLGLVVYIFQSVAEVASHQAIPPPTCCRLKVAIESNISTLSNCSTAIVPPPAD